MQRATKRTGPKPPHGSKNTQAREAAIQTLIEKNPTTEGIKGSRAYLRRRLRYTPPVMPTDAERPRQTDVSRYMRGTGPATRTHRRWGLSGPTPSQDRAS